MSPQPPPPPPPPPREQRGSGGRMGGMSSLPRWTIWVLLGVAAAAFLLPTFFSGSEGRDLKYSEFLTQVQADNVKSIEWNNSNGHINGEFADGAKFTTTGVPSPPGPADADRTLFADHHVNVQFTTPETSFWAAWLPVLLPIALLIGFFVWMQRRTQSQMGG